MLNPFFRVFIAYNNVGYETFLFFADNYYSLLEGQNQEQIEEVKRALDIALRFMARRDRPWKLVVFLRGKEGTV